MANTKHFRLFQRPGNLTLIASLFLNNLLYFVYKVAMIVGLSLGVDHVRKSTITSVAASMNQDATKYFSQVTVHSKAPTAECFPQSFADHLCSALRY